jgi:hypothetical protein
LRRACKEEERRISDGSLSLSAMIRREVKPGQGTHLVDLERLVDLVLAFDSAEHHPEHCSVLDRLGSSLSEVREGRVTSIADERSVAIDPRVERTVTSKLPFKNVSFWYKVEKLLDARAEVGKRLEHLGLGSGGCPAVGFDESAVGVGGRL